MKTINGKQLRTNLEEKKVFAVAIDPEVNYKKGHITGSVNIPFDDQKFTQRVAEQLPNKKKPITLCAQNGFSRELKNCAEKLEESGYSQVSAYQGDMEDWKTANIEYRQGQ